MLSRRSPSPQPRAHLTARLSPPKPHFITLCTARPAAQLFPQEQNAHRPTLALSPNRNTPKIKLVSPLKLVNRSDPTTKENSPTPYALLKMDQAASPGKPKYIELGGNTMRPLPRNLNEISNISIKHHLEGEKRSSPSRPIPNKYSAFVIMGHKRAEIARPQQHITINHKHFDISSLQSQVIHVAPFHHIRTHTHAPPPVIREETEHSSLRDSYQEELRGIQDMRRELEVESSRVREALTASRLDHQVCTSQLVYANEEERSQRRSPSKLFNFQDVPLHQSRLQTEEKLQHLIDNCPQPRQSQEVVQIMYEQAANTPCMHNQPVPICSSIAPVPLTGITSEKTLINQLNFVTNNKLAPNPRDEVCVQTEEGPSTARSKLAIVRNEECLIKLGTDLHSCEPLLEIHQESIIEEPQDEIAVDANEVEEKQPSIIQQKSAIMVNQVEEKQQSIIQQKSAILDEPPSSQLLAMLQEHNQEVVVKEEQLKSHEIVEMPRECHLSKPSICSQTILVPQRQTPVSSQKHFRADSNLSLQLQQPIPMQQQAPDHSQLAISDKMEVKVPKVALQQLSRREQREKPTILSLQSARSASGKQAWTKRNAVSKRSIHNSIYL